MTWIIIFCVVQVFINAIFLLLFWRNRELHLAANNIFKAHDGVLKRLNETVATVEDKAWGAHIRCDSITKSLKDLEITLSTKMHSLSFVANHPNLKSKED